MKFRNLHPWNVTCDKAVEIQKSLRTEVAFKKSAGRIRFVAGADVACSRRPGTSWAAVVVMTYPEMELVERAWISGIPQFPYIPGLLSFRELPLVLQALGKLRTAPHLILCDGQGIAHPRRMGLASHLGVVTGTPTIGCAKKRLVGTYEQVGVQRGAYSLLHHNGEIVGSVLRTQSGVKPLFVSPGHGVTIEDSIEIVMACTGRYRLAEPVRQAHLLVTRQRRMEEDIYDGCRCS